MYKDVNMCVAHLLRWRLVSVVRLFELFFFASNQLIMSLFNCVLVGQICLGVSDFQIGVCCNELTGMSTSIELKIILYGVKWSEAYLWCKVHAHLGYDSRMCETSPKNLEWRGDFMEALQYPEAGCSCRKSSFYKPKCWSAGDRHPGHCLVSGLWLIWEQPRSQSSWYFVSKGQTRSFVQNGWNVCQGPF